MSFTIKAGSLFTGNRNEEDKFIKMSEGKIASIEPETSGTIDLDFSDYTVVPGFIDIHTHGYYGFDSFNSEDRDILEWAQRIVETGVTSFMPSLVSLPLRDIYGQFERYRSLLKTTREGAKILGLRCEGPYLSKEKRGAHNVENLRTPGLKEMHQFFQKGSGILKIIDIAPELGDMGSIITLAKKEKVVVSTGHSNADYSTALRAFSSGSSLVTHFYNAMSNLSHREVGLVGAGLLNEDVSLELIADLHHVSSEAIEIMVKLRGFKHIVLVTDSLGVGDANTSDFTLGGLPVTLHDGVAWIGDSDTIAGSVLTMDKALRNLMSIGFRMDDLIFSTSGIQSRILGLDHIGSLKTGNWADLCVLDEEGHVIATYVNGNLTFKNF